MSRLITLVAPALLVFGLTGCTVEFGKGANQPGFVGGGASNMDYDTTPEDDGGGDDTGGGGGDDDTASGDCIAPVIVSASARYDNYVIDDVDTIVIEVEAEYYDEDGDLEGGTINYGWYYDPSDYVGASSMEISADNESLVIDDTTLFFAFTGTNVIEGENEFSMTIVDACGLRSDGTGKITVE